MVRALSSYVKAGIGLRPDNDTKIVVKKLIYRLVRGRDLWTFHRICVDCAILFGLKFATPQFLKHVDNIDKPTDRKGAAKSAYKN